MIIRIMFFRFRMKPRIPIKNKTKERFICKFIVPYGQV
jgi:hypothetical protein